MRFFLGEKMFSGVEDKKVENTPNEVATTSSSPQVQKAKLILKVQPEENLIQVSKILSSVSEIQQCKSVTPNSDN